MSYSLVQWDIGVVGFPSNVWLLNTDASYATVTTAGYIKEPAMNPGDWVVANLASNVHLLFQPVISSGVITLTNTAGEVALPTIAGEIAAFSDTSGSLQGGYSPSVTNPLGGLTLGASGVAGPLVMYPATASKGTLTISATANTGNTATTITNAAMGQATAFTIPDPGTTAANLCYKYNTLTAGNFLVTGRTNGGLVDSGYSLTAQTLSFPAGASENVFSVTGTKSTTIAVATIIASTNPVSVRLIVPSTNLIDMTLTGVPGAGTTVSLITMTPNP